MKERRRRRAERRERDLGRQRLAQEIERLAALEEGGSPQRPIAIDSTAVVEIRAVARPCPLCGEPLKLDAHTAEVIDGIRLRVAAVACTLCGTRRAVYFRLAEPAVH